MRQRHKWNVLIGEDKWYASSLSCGQTKYLAFYLHAENVRASVKNTMAIAYENNHSTVQYLRISNVNKHISSFVIRFEWAIASV